MIPLWLAGIGGRFVTWLPTLLAAILEVLVKPATWLLIAVAALGGSIYGGNVQKDLCAQEKRQSVEAARRIDAEAARIVAEQAREQREAAEDRAADAEKQIAAYKDALAQQKPAEGCATQEDFQALMDRLGDKPRHMPLPPRRP